MEGTIHSFRRGRKTVSGNHVIAIVKDTDNREKASKLVGKKAVWKSPAGKEIKGVVKAAHGNKGALRILFEKGMPGQSIGEKVKIE